MKKYLITTSFASDTIPETLHIERNDELCETLGITDSYSDFDACNDALKDGVKLINDIEGIYNNFYLDTTDNRKIIELYLCSHNFIKQKK